MPDPATVSGKIVNLRPLHQLHRRRQLRSAGKPSSRRSIPMSRTSRSSASPTMPARSPRVSPPAIMATFSRCPTRFRSMSWATSSCPSNDLDHRARTGTSPIAGPVEGHVYGLTFGVSADGVVYNKEAFKKAGIDRSPDQTTPSSKAAYEKLKAAGSIRSSSTLADGWPLTFVAKAFAGRHLGRPQLRQHDSSTTTRRSTPTSPGASRSPSSRT